MKLLSRKIEKNSHGSIKLLPQEEEDMWHVYNLLAIGDYVTAVAFRKVQKESKTGSVSTNKVKLKLKISVDSIDFDSAMCQVRIKGKNYTENEFVKLGAYHTMELDLQFPVEIEKASWDSVYLDRVDLACDPRQSAEVAAVVMQTGLAHVCLITSHMTLIRAKVEIAVPKKRAGNFGGGGSSAGGGQGGANGHDKGVQRFYAAVYEAIRRHVDFKIVKCCLLASPGFVKNDFFAYMIDQATKKGDRDVLDNRGKFLLCHSSSGFKHALNDVLNDPSVSGRIESTKAFGEVKALEAFHEMLNTDPDRAYYGYEHVRLANESKAVDTLLVTDGLFRSAQLATRKKYVDLVESVKEQGGDVKVFSTLHVSGEQLNQLSGVAAILRFPMPDIDEGVGETEGAEDDGSDSDDDHENTSRKGLEPTELKRSDSNLSQRSTSSTTSTGNAGSASVGQISQDLHAAHLSRTTSELSTMSEEAERDLADFEQDFL